MESPTPKGGRHARSAALLCREPEFLLYLDRRARAKFNRNIPDGTHTAEDAKQFILQVCGISSRAELDHNGEAAQRYFYIMRCYGKYRTNNQRNRMV